MKSVFKSYLNRLQNAYEGGPIEMNAKASGQVSYGMRTSDVGGRKSLEYRTGEESIRFDYYATSVGMNLGATRSVDSLHPLSIIRNTR